MSGSGLARPAGWNLGRAGLDARVAGAHLAVPRFDRIDAGTRLVRGTFSWGTMEFFVAPSSRLGAGRVDDSGGGAMESQVYRLNGDEPHIGPSATVFTD